MKYSFLIAVFASVFISCNEGGKENGNEDNKVRHHSEAGAKFDSGCFMMTINRDTAILQLDLHDDSVGGTLEYRWYEKDRNKGIVNGILYDSLLHASYRFMSEGLESVREVSFLVHGDSLFQGSGEMTERNDTIVYVDRNNLQYDTLHPFIRIMCD